MRVVGVDLGTRRVGLARSDPSGLLASPWRVLHRTGDQSADRRALAEAVQEAGAARVVVGMPLSLDGRRGPAAQRAETEIDALRAALAPHHVHVECVDERMSTVSAQAALRAAGVRARRQRDVIDAAAAAVLLQAWLDGRR